MTEKIAKTYIETFFKKNKDLDKFYSHGLYCKKISKELLNGLISLNFFEDEEKKLYEKNSKLLYLASILHDLGEFIPSDKPHNKKGAKFIVENKIHNLTEEENLIVANLVRFHRGKSPKDKNKLFNLLDDTQKQLVRTFSGILRISDALDYNHYEICEKVLLEDDKENKILTILVDFSLKENVGFKLVFKKKSKLLRKLLDRKIVLKAD